MSKFLKYSIWIIFFTCIFITVISIFRGIILNDEGYIINSAVRILNGQTMYRDFHFAYTPGSVFITTALFSILGQSLFAERVGTVLLTIITSLLLYALGYKITIQKTYSLLPVLIFLAWGPTHINFLWPVMLSIPIGLTACLYLIKTTETKKSLYLFIAGCLTTILFLFKQNFGFGVLSVFCMLFLFQKELRTRVNIIFYITGLIVISGIFAAYLHLTGSLHAFIQDMYDYTIARILIEHALDTPFFYGATLIQKIGKAIIYLSPLYLSLIAIFIVIGRKPKLIVLPIFCTVFFLLGIRPTTDYVHLAPLLAITGLPMLLIIAKTKHRVLKSIAALVFAILVFCGFYTAFFLGYYRWQPPLFRHTDYLTGQKTHIWVSRENSQELKIIHKTVSAYALKDKFIYVYDYQPMIYFLTNKQNPTKFDLLAHNQYFLKAMPQIVQILKQNKIKLIITNKFFDDDKTLLAEFIRTNYHRVGQSENFYFWTKNF